MTICDGMNQIDLFVTINDSPLFPSCFIAGCDTVREQ